MSPGTRNEVQTHADGSQGQPETPWRIADGYLAYERYVRQASGGREVGEEEASFLIERRNEFAGKLIDQVIATRPPAARVGAIREASLLARCVRIDVPYFDGTTEYPEPAGHTTHIFAYDDATDQLIVVVFADREIGIDDLAGM